MIEPVEVHVQGQRIRVRGDAANEPLALDVHVDAECETREVNAIFRAATLGEHRIFGTREFSSETVSASKPAPRRIYAYSVERFSSTLNFKL